MTDTQDRIANEKDPDENTGKQPKALSHLEAKRAQNLRDNLLKRKQQAKARSESDDSNGGPRKGV